MVAQLYPPACHCFGQALVSKCPPSICSCFPARHQPALLLLAVGTAAGVSKGVPHLPLPFMLQKTGERMSEHPSLFTRLPASQLHRNFRQAEEQVGKGRRYLVHV